MKKNMNRFLRIILIVIGIFLATAISMFVMVKLQSSVDLTLISSSLIAGGIVAGLSIPVLLWLVLKTPSLDSYSGFALEEIDMNEDELAEAVANWVFTTHRKRVEDDLRFLEDDDGNVTCRVTVRID